MTLPMLLAIGFAAALTHLAWVVARTYGPIRALPPYDLRTIALGAIGGALIELGPTAAPNAILAVIAVSATSVASTVDQRSGFVPDVVTLPALAVVVALVMGAGHVAQAALGIAVLGGAMAALHFGTAGRGLGFGDVKLVAVIGASFGMLAGAYAVGAAFVLGAIGGIALLLRGRASRDTEMRFAPYLLCGVLLACVRG